MVTVGFFPLTFQATVQQETVTYAANSGQQFKAWTTVGTYNCAYMENRGSRITNPREEYEAINAVYFDPSVPIQAGYRIINISDMNGAVIYGGPFIVLSVKKMGGLGGLMHHKTCMVTGPTGGSL